MHACSMLRQQTPGARSAISNCVVQLPISDDAKAAFIEYRMIRRARLYIDDGRGAATG
jgi:hypothetical protein